jgi:hypothetical protein
MIAKAALRVTANPCWFGPFTVPLSGVVSRAASCHTLWCLAQLYSECYAFPESLAYAATHHKLHARCAAPNVGPGEKRLDRH